MEGAGTPTVFAVHAVGIDVGSTNVKVALVAADGSLVADAAEPLETLRRDDAVEQDTDQVWAAVARAVRSVTHARPDAAAQVGAIGVCSQYSSIVPVDASGTAVAPLVTYMDQRGGEHCWAILERHPEAFVTWVERHGIPPIGGGLSLAHLLHFQLDRPEVHRRTAAYLEVMDLVNLRLTGRAAATQCTAFASQLCDNRQVPVTSYDDELVGLSGVDPTRLPSLLPVDGTVGELDGAVAAQLGLPPGVVVTAGMNDTQAGAFATGSARTDPSSPGVCGAAIGTTAVLIRPLDSMAVDLEHEVLSMPAPLAGRYVVMAENGVAGAAVEHALSLLAPGGGGFDELDAALADAPAGAGGVLFLPWLSGSMSPSSAPDMRGGFVGMSLSTTRAELLRATVEGVARNLRWLAPAVEGLAGGPTREVVLGGGGARSSAWARTLADVLGTPVSVLERPELAAARATGMVALRRTEGADPADVRIPVAARVEPDPEAVEVHAALQGPFEDAFTALRPVCEALRP